MICVLCGSVLQSVLPGLVDQKEITAALRQCNYDPEEVISVYLTMFGEILLQTSPSGDHNYTDLNSFRSSTNSLFTHQQQAVYLKQNLKLEYTDLTSLNSSPDFLFRPCRALLERDRVIEDLRLKLRTKEKEVDSLFQRNSYLAREVRYLSDVIQHLNQKLAELEADQQEAREKIRSLLNRRLSAVPPVKTITEPTVEPGQLRQVSRLTRELNVSNKQLRSTVQQALTDMKNQLEQLKGAAGKLPLLEQEAAGEVEELRSLYRKEAVERKSLYNKLLELQGNIRVFCRCRRTNASSSCVEKTDDQEVVVVQKGSRKKFQFDKVYPQSSTQVRTHLHLSPPPSTTLNRLMGKIITPGLAPPSFLPAGGRVCRNSAGDNFLCGRIQRLYSGLRTNWLRKDLHHDGQQGEPRSQHQVRAGVVKTCLIATPGL